MVRLSGRLRVSRICGLAAGSPLDADFGANDSPIKVLKGALCITVVPSPLARFGSAPWPGITPPSQPSDEGKNGGGEMIVTVARHHMTRTADIDVIGVRYELEKFFGMCLLHELGGCAAHQ